MDSNSTSYPFRELDKSEVRVAFEIDFGVELTAKEVGGFMIYLI